MNKATLAIPTRWEAGILQIKQWVEDYSAKHGVGFEVVLAPQVDSGKIYIIDHTLTNFEWQICDNAIDIIGSHLTHINQRRNDVWKSRHDVTEELEQQLQEISDAQPS